MAARKYVATGTVRVDLATAARITFGTIGFVVRFTNYQGTTNYRRMMGLVNAAGDTDLWSVDRSYTDPNHRVTLVNDIGTNRFVNVNSIISSGVYLILVTKTSGTTTPRLHVWDGSSWTHTNFSGTQANCSTPRYLYLGGRFAQLGDVDWQPNWLHMVGLFNTSLSDSACEALTAGARAWLTRSDCVGFWQLTGELFAQGIPDLSGTGSTLDSDSGATEIDTAEMSPIPLIGPVKHHHRRLMGVV